MWTLTEHACRFCSGRLLTRRTPDGQEVIRCAECGSERTGDPLALCWCGSGTAFRCTRNPAITGEMPAEIIVVTRADSNPLQGNTPWQNH